MNVNYSVHTGVLTSWKATEREGNWETRDNNMGKSLNAKHGIHRGERLRERGNTKYTQV